MLTNKQKKELAALAALPEDQIDLTDVPEVREWRRAVVGRFYRPKKESLTIRLDADVLAWLRIGGRGYQTRINLLLRSAMEGRAARPRGEAAADRARGAVTKRKDREAGGSLEDLRKTFPCIKNMRAATERSKTFVTLLSEGRLQAA